MPDVNDNPPIAEIEQKSYMKRLDFPSIIDALDYLHDRELEILEKELVRNIRGEPIPEQEVTRGTKINAKTLHTELERWRAHPILSKYAPTVEEEKVLLAKWTSPSKQ